METKAETKSGAGAGRGGGDAGGECAAEAGGDSGSSPEAADERGGDGDGQELPSTVRVLSAGPAERGRVYLVGTAHFSRESQADVARVIRHVQPHVVMVELCSQRTNILLVDEDTILKEARSIDLAKIRSSIAQSGLFNGLMYILLLNMSAHLTRSLGMAPGGEFRTALSEARRVPGCALTLGDRPIDVTLQRALASLSWWQAARLAAHLLWSDMDVSAEEVEKCKQKKLLEQMLEEMGEEFPTLKRVFVEERDVFLAHSLRAALGAAGAAGAGEEPRVVGVVGMGHVAGIADNWDTVRPAQIGELLKVPPPALSTRAVRLAARLAAAGALVYVGWRVLPRLVQRLR